MAKEKNEQKSGECQKKQMCSEIENVVGMERSKQLNNIVIKALPNIFPLGSENYL